MLDVKRNGFVAEFVDEIAFPIPLQASWQQSIKETLQGREGHGKQQSKVWRSELTNGFVHLFCLVRRSCVRPNNATHGFGMERCREWRAGRNFQKCKESIEILRSLRHELPVPAHHLGSLIHLPKHRSAENGLNRLS